MDIEWQPCTGFQGREGGGGGGGGVQGQGILSSFWEI